MSRTWILGNRAFWCSKGDFIAARWVLTQQGMQHSPRVVVEDVDPAVLVAGSRESSIGGLW